ncbi:MAG TPA: hypothetical protein VHS31_08910 [Tepidisphaeraceae bacterium]|nr:hypothetical protein [Tepidisphaeraceae bacterium]
MQFKTQRGDTVAEFDILRREHRLVDAAGEMKVQQAFLLPAHILKLAIKAGASGASVLLMLSGGCNQRVAEPGAERLRLLQLFEQRAHLNVDFFFAQTIARMVGRRVAGAAIIDVFLAALFLHDLTGHWTTAVAAVDQFTGENKLVRLINLLTKQTLNTLKCLSINNGDVLALLPMAMPLQVADVAAITQDAVDFASHPMRLFHGVGSAISIQSCHNHINRTAMIGIQVEDVLHVFRFMRLDLHDASAIDSLADISIGRDGREPTIADTLRQPLFHVHRQLLGEERSHRRHHVSSHTTSGCVLCGLADGDERNAVSDFQFKELAVVRHVSGGPVNLVDEKAIDLVSVGLCIGQQFLEAGTAVGLARGFSDLPEARDRSTILLRVGTQFLLLHLKRESFILLSTAAHPRQRDISFGLAILMLDFLLRIHCRRLLQGRGTDCRPSSTSRWRPRR